MRSFDGAAGAPAASMTTIRSPIETRSPPLTLISLTVPACEAGTSMVALSDSRLISGSSTLIWEPGWTWTSMIGTSLKSPMSGTRISLVLMGRSRWERPFGRAVDDGAGTRGPDPSQDQGTHGLGPGAGRGGGRGR